MPVVKHLARVGLKKLVSDPEAREKAIKVARTVTEEAKQIAAEPDRARAAGKAFNRAVRTFKPKE